MRISAARPGSISLALLLLVSLCGCATHEAKQGTSDDLLQATGHKQVIVVPIFIVSPPENGSAGNGVDLPPGSDSPDPATHRGDPLPAKM